MGRGPWTDTGRATRAGTRDAGRGTRAAGRGPRAQDTGCRTRAAVPRSAGSMPRSALRRLHAAVMKDLLENLPEHEFKKVVKDLNKPQTLNSKQTPNPKQTLKPLSPQTKPKP